MMQMRGNQRRDVSTHASVRRRRLRDLRRAGAARVSTHASVRRRRRGPDGAGDPYSFNSRLREEATLHKV